MAHRWIGALASAVFTLVFATAALAEDPVGDWLGMLNSPAMGQMQMAVHLKKTASGYDGTADNLTYGARGLLVSEVKVEGDSLAFEVKAARATYRGQWDAKAAHWAGTWTVGSNALPFNLARGKAPPAPTVTGLDGDWQGSLATPGGIALRLLVHIKTGDQGTVATLDSLDQGALGLPIAAIERQGQTVRLDVKSVRGTFEGTLSEDGQTLTGQWTQGGPMPLTLKRLAPGETAAAPKRPQTPAKPYPYGEEEVAFENAPADATLAGTLTLPKGQGPFPAAILISGSGPQDRDETLLGHKPFLVIADHLTREGIAVLRYDDRGTARSTGRFSTALSTDFADDAAAAVAYLRTRPEIDPARIGLIGHSEGGLIAPMVAAKDPKLVFIVLLAGPAVRGDAVLKLQQRRVAEAAGAPAAMVERNAAMMDKLLAAVREAPDSEAAMAAARTAMESEARALGLPPTALNAQANMMGSDWFRFFLSYDPAPTLSALTLPVLALNGSKDVQVPPDQNLPAMKRALARNPKATVMEMTDLNHLFQTAKTGGAAEYSTIEETFAPKALKIISDWISATTKR